MVADKAYSDLLLGIDIGASNVKVALCDPLHDPLYQACAPSRGYALASLLQILSDIPDRLCFDRLIKVALTGSGQSLLAHLSGIRSVNEILATAWGVWCEYHQACTVVEIGGQSSKLIMISAQGQIVDFSSNGLCAAGAGVFLEQQAGRLGLTVEELGRLAAGAHRGASVAGRCSVFAKSDMIHLQQKGTPLDEIALGLCQAMARTFVSNVMQSRNIEPPLVLVGGGAVNRGLVRAFRDLFGIPADQLLVPSYPLHAGARGAAREAAEGTPRRMEQLLTELRDRLSLISAPVAPGQGSLAPLCLSASCSEIQAPESPSPASGPVDAYLGVDVGSVSTNLVLLSPEQKVLQGIYLPTQGRPVDAVNDGLRQIRERFGERLHILGVGSTGSGRHLAAKVIGADVVHNEITAQMVSSLFFESDVDTIFEIGGQDSKYISVHDHKIADFEMNKICAGGTGSFLEEQAGRLGIRIVDEFAELALKASSPCDL